MCLTKLYDDEKKEKMLSELKKDGEGFLTVYKAVERKKNQYWPTCQRTQDGFATGRNIAVRKQVPVDSKSEESYITGFHFFISPKTPIQMLVDASGKCSKRHINKFRLIKCKIKEEDIEEIGYDAFNDHCIVAKIAYFPSPHKYSEVEFNPRTDMPSEG